LATPVNIYAHAGAGMLGSVAREALPRIYVPNSISNTVVEIDPKTYKIVRRFKVDRLPQHITPSYDFKTLYVLSNAGNSLRPIERRPGNPGRRIPVPDPYNMYFTLDGRYAIVVAERNRRLDFRDPHTFALRKSLGVPCKGIDHLDFSADGSYAIVSCEFSGDVLKVDMPQRKVSKALRLPLGIRSRPQDVKLSPDGKVFYVADETANGLWEIDGGRFAVIGFLPTGKGVHGLYVSRDATRLYATNRRGGSISVIDFRTRKVIATWRLPGGGSPDMGGVSADGRTLWLTGRYNSVVYALDAQNGRLLARVPVGRGPHGLCVWPQPGRYSLGHTGITR
jgi:YVTN family beta-propeller protein